MSLEQTTGNLEIRYANVVTFVGSSNTMVDTTTGRIQTKGIQHNSNVITDISGPHGRVAPSLKRYPEIAFTEAKFDRNDTTNTYVQAGYTVSASSQDSSTADMFAYQAFNGGATVHEWRSGSASNYGGAGGIFNNTNTHYQIATTDVDGVTIPHGEWLKIKMPKKIRLESVFLTPAATNFTPENFKIYGSNDGTTWKLLITQSGLVPVSAGNSIIPATTISGYYNEYVIVITKIYNNAQPDTSIKELEYYGYEEDPPAGDHSVDTTFKSRFNNPQLTGVQVLVDGATGVGTNHISGGADPSGNQAIMTSPNKYWTLNGTLTSNLSVEANTFLEGDQPHAVSVWFNSSNLEMNVSNTCVFSISDQEKLDSVNLDLQSNTWHNLTYTYQGEGGSRVTYLDGRKVADDKVEDTFGDYPPFAMTGSSQSGYVVSARSEYDSSNNAVKAFDDNTGTGYKPMDSAYDSSGNLDSGGTFAISASGTTPGEWIKMKMPHKLVVSYLFMQSIATSTGPSDFKLFGSNDDVNWDELLSIVGQTTATAGTSNAVNASKGYKYLAIVVAKTLSSVDLQIGEIKFYGHRENDLIRFPDPTNVLKYPHIAMTGPAQRGYVATASAQLYDSPPWEAFDESVATNSSGWIWNTSGTHNLGTDSGSGTTTDGGHWIRLELPYKLVVTRVDVISDAQNPQGQDEFPDEYAVYGWNGSGAWTKLLDVTGKNPTIGTSTILSDTISNSTAYKYLALEAKSYYDNSSNFGRIAGIKYYGTGVDSIPIQIGGGNIDKVANFRVYDKFIQQDQALEIWNAQKDEFERAKSQMVLQQGNLGIGTTGPTTTLDVVGDARITESITSTTSLVSNAMTIGTTKTFVVTVSGANKYLIDGDSQASLTLHQHQTYIFDLSSSTLATHPFIFSDANTNDGNANGTPYTTGITTTGTTRTFAVTADTPTTLYYYCTSHTGMGGTITISPEAELIVTGTVEATNFSGSGAGLTSIPSSAISGTLSQWTTNGTMINYMDGNVGIGVASPGAKLHVAGAGAIIVPSGTEAQRPTPYVAGMVRYNTEDTTLELFNGTDWLNITLTPPTLYNFTSHIFHPCGKRGRDGPTITDCLNNYGNVLPWNDSNFFNITGYGIQEWVVPKTTTYTIEAIGAGLYSFNDGGYGAKIRADNVSLTKGETIKILCGQLPSGTTNNNSNHGGGGGTFVVRTPYNTNASIILIAGGGGGAHNYGHRVRSNGQLGTSGADGEGGGAGGTNGNAGGNGQGIGGAGFFQDRTPSGSYSGGAGALSFINGGRGGVDGSSNEAGFGGGNRHGGTHGGGAGGYSGGGGSSNHPYNGGGGGSYTANITVGASDNTTWDQRGQVTITMN